MSWQDEAIPGAPPAAAPAGGGGGVSGAMTVDNLGTQPPPVKIDKSDRSVKLAMAGTSGEQARDASLEALPGVKSEYDSTVANLKPPRSPAEAQAQADLRASPPDPGAAPDTGAAPTWMSHAVPTPPAPAPLPPEPTLTEKVVGGIEAGINLITGLTGPASAYQPTTALGKQYVTGAQEGAANIASTLVGGPLGFAGGTIGGIAGGISTVARRSSEGVPQDAEAQAAHMMGRKPAGNDLYQSASEGAQKLIYEPKGQIGQNIAESAGNALNEAAPLLGHTGELGAMHEAGLPDAAQTKMLVPGSEARAAAATKAAALAQPELEGIRAAHDAGYVLTPKAAQAGLGARIAESAAGSARLAQGLSARNAENTARLARADVGLPDDVPATPEATAGIRKTAGQAYAAVQDVGPFENDAQYGKDLDTIAAPIEKAAVDYPDSKLADHPLLSTIEGLRTDGPVNTGSAIEMVKQLRSKSDVAFRDGDKNLGNQYRAVAGAVDNSMDRALGRMADAGNDPELTGAVDKYRAARVTIAKTYLLDDAMDGKPGEVNAKVYGRALDSGTPLTGPALQIANFAKQFGDEGLAAKKGRSGAVGPTYHDILLGALLHAPTAAGAMVARPVTRAFLGSDFMQRRMAGSKPKPFVPGPEAPPPEPTTSPGAGGGGGGGAPPAGPGPLGDLTPEWGTTPGAGGGPPRGGHEPGLVPAVGETPPTTGNRKAPLQMPTVPGRPDLPDTMTTGGPAESAATDRANAAMNEPGAIEARRQQTAEPEAARAPDTPGPRAAEAQRILAENPEPEVRKVVENHLAGVQRTDRAQAQQAADNIKAAQLERAARETTDTDLQKRLLAEADKLRGTERIPVGKTIEGQPEIKAGAPTKPLPVGKAIEGEPAPEKVPAGKATEREMTPEEEKSWRTQFGLGAEDAQRAKDVAQALKHDPKATEAAAVQHENQPRAFDRAIADINEKGEASANEAKSAAEGGQGNPDNAGTAGTAGAPVRPGEGAEGIRGGTVADRGSASGEASAGHDTVPAARAGAGANAEPEPGAAVRGTAEQPRANGVPEAGRGSVSATGEGRQGAGGEEGPGAAGVAPFDPRDFAKASAASAFDQRHAYENARESFRENLIDTMGDEKTDQHTQEEAFRIFDAEADRLFGKKGKTNDTANQPGDAGDLRGAGQEAKGPLEDEAFKADEGGAKPDQNGAGTPEAGVGPVAPTPFGNAKAMDKFIREQGGDKLIDGLRNRGLLKYSNSIADSNPKAGAIMRQPNYPDLANHEDTAATLYYDKLHEGNVMGVLMHELGEHFGIERVLGTSRYLAMLSDLKSLKETPEVAEAWAHVEKNYVGEGTVTNYPSMDNVNAIREVAARLVETHPDLPFVRRLISEIRAFFYEHFGTTLGNTVDASLIRGLAASALRKAGEGKLIGQKPLVPRATAPPTTPRPFVQKTTPRSDGFPPLYQ